MKYTVLRYQMGGIHKNVDNFALTLTKKFRIFDTTTNNTMYNNTRSMGNETLQLFPGSRAWMGARQNERTRRARNSRQNFVLFLRIGKREICLFGGGYGLINIFVRKGH